jgi:DNA repair exonuclease SbcCD ATPase subunit
LITDYERDIRLHKEYQGIQKELTSLETIDQEYQNLQQQKQKLLELFEGQYQCPKCHTHLCLLNNELVEGESQSCLSTSQKKKMVQHLDKQMDQLQNSLKSLEHYRSKIVELEEQIDPEERVEDLEKDYQWISGYYQKNRDQASKQQIIQKQQKQLRDKIIPELSIEHCNDYLQRIGQQKQILDKIKYFQSQFDELNAQNPDNNLNNDSNNIQTIQTQLKTIEQQIKEYKSQQHLFELYQIKMEQYNKYIQHQNTLEKVQKEMEQLEKQMTAVLEFKQLILKTESEIIDQKTLEISQRVNQYLEQIFSEPITVELKTIKRTQTSNEKVQVQLEVYYKNMKCDVSLLSGGEQARMNLAFILAFASIFKSPLLLLDECTSNLDQELTEIVMEQIQNVGIPKVILIAHQIVEGNFKQILNV